MNLRLFFLLLLSALSMARPFPENDTTLENMDNVNIYFFNYRNLLILEQEF